MNGKLNRSTMSNKSRPKTPDASAVTLNAADIKKVRSAVKLHGETKANDVESGDGTRSYESNGSSELLYTSSKTDELFDRSDIQDESTHFECDKMEDVQGMCTNSEAEVEDGDIQNVCVKHKEQGLSQLHLAAERGDKETVRSLLMSSANVDVLDTKHNTPLHYASLNGHVDVINLLLSKNANVNACNNAKMTPLHLACEKGHTSIVEILLDNHAIVDVTKQSEETPFYLAAKNGHAGVSELLLRRGFCDFVETSSIQEPLHVAIEEGHTEVVEVILKHSCWISEQFTNDGENLQENGGVTPVELMKSDSRRVSAEIVWAERDTTLVIHRYPHGGAPLVLTALTMQLKSNQRMFSVEQWIVSKMQIAHSLYLTITEILNRNFSQEVLNDDTKFRLIFRTLAQVLMNSSLFNANHRDNGLNAFLHGVIGRNHEHPSVGCFTKESNEQRLQIQIIQDVIQLLLGKGADFNMKNFYGKTPLIIASEKGCCHLIQILFAWEEKSGKKLDFDARDRNGATALIKAAERHHVSVVQMLLSHKVSVNLQDYYGFTALHAAIYEPNRNWFNVTFFCKRLRKRKFNSEEYPEIDHGGYLTWREPPVNRIKAIYQQEKFLEHDEKSSRIKEEMVKLLLAIDETNVNAKDVKGNTPLDLAVKSSKRITSATFEALKNRGAIRKSKEPEDEASIEVARVDKRGLNPLHRLIMFRVLYEADEDKKAVTVKQYIERFHLMVDGILLRPENFRHLAVATDDKGRMPLHYAVMQSYLADLYHYRVKVLIKLGSNVNAADMYGKPLYIKQKGSSSTNFSSITELMKTQKIKRVIHLDILISYENRRL